MKTLLFTLLIGVSGIGFASTATTASSSINTSMIMCEVVEPCKFIDDIFMCVNTIKANPTTGEVILFTGETFFPDQHRNLGFAEYRVDEDGTVFSFDDDDTWVIIDHDGSLRFIFEEDFGFEGKCYFVK